MNLERFLIKKKVLRRGHFLLSSGLHSEYYFEKFRILEDPAATKRLARVIVEQFRDKGIQWVIGPLTGGYEIAYEVARNLKCFCGVAELKDGRRIVGREFDIEGKNILIADDVLTTGGSILTTIEAIREKKGNIVGVAVLIDRSSTQMPFQYFSVYHRSLVNYSPNECPLCKKGGELVRPGTSP